MNKSRNIGSWALAILGLIGMAISLQEIDNGISTGVFSYTSAKFGFTFTGVPALVMEIGWLIISAVLAFGGYRGIKNSGQDGA